LSKLAPSSAVVENPPALARTAHLEERLGESPGQITLKFISGKYQGGEYPLPATGEILIGRSSDLDMVLVEDMVSRKHARITIKRSSLSIQDLGSTNGTFVNGEKVRKAGLSEGDRLLIGTSIMKLVGAAPGDPVVEVATPKGGFSDEKTDAGQAMAGRIEDVGLAELLQLFSQGKKDGDLVVRAEGDEATIHLRGGAITRVAMDSIPGGNSYKALYRTLAWDEGSFELLPALKPGKDEEVHEPLPESVEALLMEGSRQRDELAQIRKKLPDADSALAIATPLLPPLSKLTPELLDTLQLIHNYGAAKAVLDRSDATDLDTANELIYLAKNKYIREA
jgi:hypothetical protein